MKKPKLYLNRKTLLPYVSMEPTRVKGLDVIEIEFPETALWKLKLDDVAKPGFNVILTYMVGEGGKAHGLIPQITILFDGENFFRRVTYKDVGIKGKQCGLSRKRKDGLCWYIKKVDLPREVFDNAVKEE